MGNTFEFWKGSLQLHFLVENPDDPANELNKVITLTSLKPDLTAPEITQLGNALATLMKGRLHDIVRVHYDFANRN